MKKLLFSLCFIFLGISISSAQSTSISWQYTSTATQYSDAVVSKPHASGVIIAAQVNYDIIIYMLSPTGSLIWTKSYDHGQAESIVDIEIEPSTGNIFVLVNSQPLNSIDLGMDYIILKYSPGGTLLQSIVHNHIDSSWSNENDDGYDMVFDSNGYLYVLARHFHGACTAAETRIIVDKYNSSLALQWSYASPFQAVSPMSICFNNNGSLFASYKYNQIPRIGMFSPSTGSLITEALLPVPGLDGSESLKLMPDNFGNVYGVADYYMNMDPDPGVFLPKMIKVDNANQVLWSDTLCDATIPNYNHPSDLTVDSNGDLYVSYTTDAGMGYQYARLAKTNSNGTRAWTKTIGSAGYATVVYDLDITPNNEVLFATSYDNLNPNVSTYLRKFDAQGNITWTSQSYSCQAITQPTGRVAVGQNGEVYVSGDAGTSIFTIAFNGIATDINVRKFRKNSSFSVYPNPSESILHISSENNIPEQSELVIRNTLGQIIRQEKFQSNNQVIIVSDLTPGYYFLTIEINNLILDKLPFIRN